MAVSESGPPTFDEMTDLPAELREQLADRVPDLDHPRRPAPQGRRRHGKTAPGTARRRADRVRAAARRQAALHRLHQHASRLRDGLRLLRHGPRRRGPQPHQPAKSWSKMLQLQRSARPAGHERLSHVVVMGMGEPLLNLDALLPALAVAAGRDGLGISVRRITISTVGLPAGIRRLAQENCQYHLAVSLHAANDALAERTGAGQPRLRHRGDSGGGRRVFRADRPPRHVRIRVAFGRERPAGTRPAVGRICFAAGRRW